jgi:septum formation protein
MTLTLASTSPIRRRLLADAGVVFDVAEPSVDEAAVIAPFVDPASLALARAEAKALAVSARDPRAWVIGSDSVAEVGGTFLDKPRDRAEAEAHLRSFSARVLTLTSAAVLARGGEIGWRHCDSAALTVRALSEDFIQSYLNAEWPDVAYCVGVFRMEGRGVQLFDRIDGDYLPSWECRCCP